MPFQIQPISEFLVRPTLPPALSRLPEIATNVLWSWDHQLRALFRRLDPVLWRESHNPVLMLSRLQPETLAKALLSNPDLALPDASGVSPEPWKPEPVGFCRKPLFLHAPERRCRQMGFRPLPA